MKGELNAIVDIYYNLVIDLKILVLRILKEGKQQPNLNWYLGPKLVS